ncbi:MAG TPA: Holliday junction resolvase RuvX [Mycobacteriales bacterium]|nr:Holliday junction resolvase RuvX [Mycobacteriales bacterium]
MSGDDGAGRPLQRTRGVRLGIDVGSVRVGVAASDPDGLLATPVTTLARDAGDLDAIADLVRERDAIEVVVGLPRRLSGEIGPAARAAGEYARALADRIAPVPVRTVDERMTTAAASKDLSRHGVSTRKQRPVIDQLAATLILQGWLDQRKQRR